MSSLAQDLTGIMRQGFAWWAGELASLIPKSWRDGRPAGETGTVVALHQGRLSLVAEARGSKATGKGEALSEQALLDYLARKSRPGAPLSVSLRLPHAACLMRHIEVPERARAEAGSILALDLERATPLSAADVYTAHYRDPVRTNKGTIGFVQLIVKKSAVDSAVARLEAAGTRVEAVDCWAEDGTTVLPVNFLNRAADGRSPVEAARRRRIKVLGGLAALLAISAVWLSLSRHQSALLELEKQTAAARGRVVAVEGQRGGAEAAAKEALAVLTLRAGHPPTVRVLDELTRLLPDTAYLTEFSVDGDTVDISGFAKRAAGLVPLLERSQMFADAALSAPVTFDGVQDKERFSYRLRLRQVSRAVVAPDASEGNPTSPAEVTP